MRGRKRFLIPGLIFLAQATAFAQVEVTGRVIDGFTKEPVPYAYIVTGNDTIFTFTDNNGFFVIRVDASARYIVAMHSGYLPDTLPVRQIKKLYVKFELTASAGKMTGEAQVAGTAAAESFIRKIFGNRAKNNPVLHDYYTYRAYEKMQLDLNDINEDVRKKRILRPFGNLFEDGDTVASNTSPSLPFFFTESVSDVYYRLKPARKVELVRASRSAGVENLVLIQLLKDIYRNVEVYDEYINIFGKSFISPLSAEGIRQYTYVFTDSADIEGRWCYKIEFMPRNRFALAFNGSVWFHDTTFALQRITLTLDKSSRVNFIENLAYVKVFRCMEDLRWVADHEQLVVRFSRKQRGMHVSARKSRWYSNQVFNENPGDSVFAAHSYIKIEPEAFEQPDQYWEYHRCEYLSPREARIFGLVDTLKTMPAFQVYVASAVVAVTGHVPVGKVDIGPYYHLLSENEVEGYRLRLGGRTNDKFHERWRLEGYGAYGFRDQRFKFMSGLRYKLRKKPVTAIGYHYTEDLVQPGLHESTFKDEGFIVVLFRRNPTDELAELRGHKFFLETKFRWGLSARLQYLNNHYRPESISYSYFRDDSFTETSDDLHLSEVWLNLRYSFRERVLERKDRRITLGTDFPVFHLNMIRGLDGFLGGSHNYFKLAARVTHRLNVFPFGHLNYLAEAGNVWGEVPYPLLYIHRGNETRLYDYTAFNLMFHYEFITDRYVLGKVEHHLDGYLWRRLPLLRMLDWREVVTGRILFGKISDGNKNILEDPSRLDLVDLTPYVEAGVGLENILRFFRVDGVWRLTYLDPDKPGFGVRVSAQLLF